MLRRVVVAVVLLLGAGAVGAKLRSLPPNYYRPSEYEELRKTMRAELAAGLPANIPASVTGVRVYAQGPHERLPAPDWNMELRYITTPAAAAQLVAASKAVDASLKSSVTFGWSGVPDGLQTADDQEATTPLPPGFQSFLLANPDGINITGVTINAATGEVIYWIREG
jgi:hypothetical protein